MAQTGEGPAEVGALRPPAGRLLMAAGADAGEDVVLVAGMGAHTRHRPDAVPALRATPRPVGRDETVVTCLAHTYRPTPTKVGPAGVARRPLGLHYSRESQYAVALALPIKNTFQNLLYQSTPSDRVRAGHACFKCGPRP